MHSEIPPFGEKFDSSKIKDGQSYFQGKIYDAPEGYRLDSDSDLDIPWEPAISIAELCSKEFPEKKWVVENIFERASIGQISAAPNQGKTWIMLHMAICIATGHRVFEKFETDKQGVMIVNEEDTEMMLKERVLMLLGSIPESAPIYVHVEKGIKINEENVDRLIEEIDEKNVGVVIFDSLSVLHTADENSAKEMGAVFEQMKRMTRRGITVLFTNHHRKKSLKKWEKDDLQEQVRGSTVINAVPSGHITCEEKIQEGNKFVVIRQAKLKGAEKLSPFQVRVKKENEKMEFVYEGEHEESLDAANKLKEQLYQVLKESDRCLGVKDLTDVLHKSEKPIRDQLKRLVKENLIAEHTRGGAIKLNFRVSEREGARTNENVYVVI